MQKTLELAGKKILVTGASGFLGKKIISAIENEGAEAIGVDINADGDIKKLDISDKDQFSDFVKVIDGYLDGIVNCAAISFKGNNLTPKEFMKTMEVNINGTYNGITQLKDILVSEASIVNVASIYGLLSPDFRIYDYDEHLYSSSAYGASKAAIIQMTKYYAAQMAPMRVNAVSPGGIFQDHNDSFNNRYSERVPLKRMAKPEEIADAILFLLSPMSSYITGHNLVVDGGLSVW